MHMLHMAAQVVWPGFEKRKTTFNIKKAKCSTFIYMQERQCVFGCALFALIMR